MRALHYVRAECVPDTMRRANDGRIRVTVIQRPPQLLHQAHQCGIRHEAPAPDSFMQLALVDDARCFVDEDLKEVEGLRRDVDRHGAADHVPSIEVQGEGTELHDHVSPLAT